MKQCFDVTDLRSATGCFAIALVLDLCLLCILENQFPRSKNGGKVFSLKTRQVMLHLNSLVAQTPKCLFHVFCEGDIGGPVK